MDLGEKKVSVSGMISGRTLEPEIERLESIRLSRFLHSDLPNPVDFRICTPTGTALFFLRIVNR